ncbi:MAG TPA: hypothetical protein VFG11_01310 [Acidobacteriota bacterium]|nr:hypothetical protein [Acidobacteriota bacterium]
MDSLGRIDRGFITPQQDLGEPQPGLGVQTESTSLPEWQGWDRIENGSLMEAPLLIGIDMNPDLNHALGLLRNDSQYEGLSDLDDKRFLLDSMNNISSKMDDLQDKPGSEKMLNMRETFNELMDLYQTAYTHQIANIKG